MELRGVIVELWGVIVELRGVIAERRGVIVEPRSVEPSLAWLGIAALFSTAVFDPTIGSERFRTLEANLSQPDVVCPSIRRSFGTCDEQLTKHPLTDVGLEHFLVDAKKAADGAA